MSLTFIIGEIGSGKTYLMTEKIKAFAEKNKKVTLIVPEQYSSAAEMKMYNMLGITLFNRINVDTFTRIRRKIFEKSMHINTTYGIPNEAAKNVIMYTVKKEIAKEELDYFKGRIKSRSFTQNALKTVKELEMNGIDADSLLSEKITGNLKKKINDIVRLVDLYNEKLTESGYTNALSEGKEAVKAAEKADIFYDEYIFIDEFKSFTADEKMLISLMKNRGNVYVCMPTPYKNSTSSPIFATVNEEINALTRDEEAEFIIANSDNDRFVKAPDIKYIGRKLLRDENTEKTDSENIISAKFPDIPSECDFICSRISKLVRSGAYKYSEIDILTRNFENLKSAMETSFLRYNIPYYIDETRSAGKEPIIFFVNALLDIADSKDIPVEKFLNLLKTGFTQTDERDISELEIFFTEHGQRNIKWSDIKETPEKPDENIQGVEKAEYVANDVLSRVLTFKQKTAGENNLRFFTENLCELLNSFNLAECCLNNFPEESEEERNARRIRKALENAIANIGNVALPESIDLFTLSDYKEIFGNVISSSKLSAPAHSINCVTMSSADRTRPESPKVVFIAGASDGYFPYKVSESGTFSDRELEKIENTLGIKFNERISRLSTEENFIAVKSFMSPSEKLFITYSLSDYSGKAGYKSDLLEFIENTGDIKELSLSEIKPEDLISTQSSAYFQIVKNLNKDNEIDEKKLSSLVKCYGDSFKAKVLKAYDEAEKINDGSLFKLGIKRETAEKLYLSHNKYLSISPTKFEEYSKCPFMFFCDKGLKLKKYKPHSFMSNVRGTEIHNVLSEMLSEIKDNADKKNMLFHEYMDILSEEYFSERIDSILKKIYETSFPDKLYDNSATFSSAFFREKSELLEIIMHLKEEFSPRNSKFVPTAFEYKIGRSNEENKEGAVPWRVNFDEKYTALFGGSVDRIDVFEKENGEKYVRVIDYKSGGKKLKLTDYIYGLNMQMFIYLMAIIDENSRGSYFCGDNPAGILYYPSGKVKLERAKDSIDRKKKSPEKLQEIIDKSMIMNGITITDVDSIRAMERDTKGRFIPQILNTDAVHGYLNSLGTRYRSSSPEGKFLCEIIKDDPDIDKITYEILTKKEINKYNLTEFYDKFDVDSDNYDREIFKKAYYAYEYFDKNSDENMKNNLNFLFTKSGEKKEYPSSEVSLTTEEFDNLIEYSMKIIREKCSEIISGNIDKSPLQMSHPCEFCDVKAICENTEKEISSFRFKNKSEKDIIRQVRSKEKKENGK